LIHSATDFGQHLPANFCLSAVVCGLLVAIARRERNIDGTTIEDVRPASWLTRRLVVSLVLLGLVGGWGWVLWEANAGRVAERYWNEVAGLENALQQDKWQGTDDDFVTLIRDAAAASDVEPDNVKRRYWLNLYRWYSISRTVNPETGLVELPSQAIPAVERIADELSQARILCPTYGPVYGLEGQLRRFFLKQPEGGDLIRKGFKLASYDAPTCFVAGSLAAEEGDLETAGARFQRAIELDNAFYREVMPIYIDKLDRPDLFRKMAEDDPGRLLTLAKVLSAREKRASMVADLRAEALAILKERCESPDATANDFALLAGICYENTDFAAAVDYYRHALTLDYRQVWWRMNLARSLAALNQWDEAIHEARICLRLRPRMKAAENLIKKWSVQHAK
jgi:tetratricopeptide (TPR) repeat protein